MNSLHLYSVYRSGMKQTSKTLAAVVMLLCLSFSSAVFPAELTAEVDRQTVIDGEAVVLYIEGTDIPSLPDTSALNANFRIIQSGQSSSQTIVNGKRSRRVTLRLELQPKSLGTSVIPAFTVGNASSDPINIEVVARGTPGVEPRDKVFAELSVDNPNPYVQEQVILSLQIFDDGNLASADPVVEGTSEYQIETLPLDRERIVEKNGVQYRVNTFRYALFPQQSGDINIEEITIPGSIRDNSYSGNLILFNTPTRRIELKSDSISISAKPRAAASTAGWWLPVKSHEVKHEWSGDISNAKVGEPLTLTLETVATGATAAQLPEIPVPDVAGLKIYVDNPEFGSKPDATGLLSVRRDKWSVIPNRSGQLTLPEVVIKWWDTEADTERRTVIPEQQIIVATAPSDTAAPSNSTTPSDATSSVASNAGIANLSSNTQSSITSNGDIAVSGNSEEGVSSLTTDGDDAATVSALNGGTDNSAEVVPRHWLWLAVAAVTAWLVTLFAWWWSFRKRRDAISSTDNLSDTSLERKAFKKMKLLAKADESSAADPTAYSNAVIEWAQYHWPQSRIHNLPEIGIRLGDQALTENMRQFDQQRFSGHQSGHQTGDQSGGQHISIKQTQKAIEDSLQHEVAERPLQDQHALPPL